MTGKKLVAIGAVIVLLAFAFWYGGNTPGARGWRVTPTPSATPVIAVVATSTPTPTPTPIPTATPSQTPEVTAEDTPAPTPVPEPTPAPTATVPPTPQATGTDDGALTCTLTVRCDTILDQMDWLTEEKKALVPEDGVLLAETEVTFYEGESVFHVLQRALKQEKIHLEFVNTPIYNSAYIEGIGNLYEFDCGELSGWVYKVNDWFPNYGCSRYTLEDGDKVEWLYTCDLGKDVGGQMNAES